MFRRTAASGNPRHFHRKDGEGYKFLADAVIKLNGINPRVGAGLVKPLLEFKRYDKDRRKLMLEQLDRVKATPKLDNGIRELVDKALATRNSTATDTTTRPTRMMMHWMKSVPITAYNPPNSVYSTHTAITTVNP